MVGPAPGHFNRHFARFEIPRAPTDIISTEPNFPPCHGDWLASRYAGAGRREFEIQSRVFRPQPRIYRDNSRSGEPQRPRSEIIPTGVALFCPFAQIGSAARILIVRPAFRTRKGPGGHNDRRGLYFDVFSVAASGQANSPNRS